MSSLETGRRIVGVASVARLPLRSQGPRSREQGSRHTRAMSIIAHVTTSAARLYNNQLSPGIFKSPHTIVIGGTLVPLKVFVNHLGTASALAVEVVTPCP